MKKRYFISKSGRVEGECLTENPANPDNLQIVENDEISNPEKYIFSGNAFVHSPPQQSRDDKRRQRNATVAALTVTTASGKVFNADEDSQNRMVRVLKVADLTGQTSCAWVLADETVATVTKAELEEALCLSVQAMGAVWPAPYQE